MTHVDPNVFMHMLHWFAVHTGVSNESSTYYAFWSGIGSDIGEVTILGGLWMMYRKHTCHVDHCWRLSKHHVDGTPYIVCRKHHPTVPNKGVTHAHIIESAQCQTPHQ